MKRLNNEKDLINENVTRHDVPRHCEEDVVRRGNLLNGLLRHFVPRNDECYYAKHNMGKWLATPLLVERVCHENSAIPQSLLRVTDLTSYRLNVLTTSKKAAFTLAEVLVTLAVIGIVAAMTIPTLVQTYQSKAWDTADTVFSRKLTEALKVMNTQGTLAGYGSTESFVNELSKHLKITKTCTNSDLIACFSNTVIWGKDNEEVDISKLKTAKDFGQNDWNTNIVGFQLASGVTGLMAYNPACKQDEYSNQITGNDCLAVLYDVQGYTKPNTESKDLRQNGNILALGKKAGCDVEFADHCWTISKADTALTSAECNEHKDEWGITTCRSGDDDYWGGAVKKCGGTKNMPTAAQLAQLATQIYGEEIGANETKHNLTIADQTLYDTLHSKSPTVASTYFYVWSGEEYSSGNAYSRVFFTTSSGYHYTYNRDYSDGLAVCLGD